MGETVEKIYCCDHGNNDNALTAAILANRGRGNDWGPMAAMLSNQNEWMNNPFAYIMFLALFRNGFGGWDGNGVGAQGIETQAQLNAIRTQLQDNQNADCIRSAIQGNGFALSQLAQTLNIDLIHFRSVAAMFRLLSSRLPVRLVSQLNALSMLLT